MAVVALYSIKGGVGKTTAAVNIAWLAARDGIETLLCDLDPQAAATWCLRVRAPRKWSGKRLVAGGRRVEAAIRGTDYERLDLLPAALSYRSVDVRLSRHAKPRSRLSTVLAPLAARYGLVVLDCPAGLTLASLAVLRAADIVLVPVVPTPLAVAAYRTLKELHGREGAAGSGLYGFFSMVDSRKKLHRDIRAAGTSEPGMLRAAIPCASVVEQMSVRRASLPAFSRRSAACAAFESLWAELRPFTAGEQQVGPTPAGPV